MPIYIRSPAQNIFAASYHFPTNQRTSNVESFPWLKCSTTEPQDLCNICSQLNFPWLFSQSLFEYTVSDNSAESRLSEGLCLGSFGDIFLRESCSFCQLVAYAFRNGADIDMINESDKWPERDVHLMNYFFSDSGLAISPETKKGEYAVRLGVWLKSAEEDNTILNFARRTVMLQKICDETSDPIVYCGRAVAPDTKGLVQTIQEWMRPCLEDNTPLSLAPRWKETAMIRFIDTQKSCIVDSWRNQRYVCLSYTWGKVDPLVLKKDNESDLRQEGALNKYKSKLPVTIQDAIALCRTLGERFLWVDSLCIMQDTVDKHDQIQQMDRIYQEAALTIIAAAGRDANAGLPGVSGPRDVRQRVLKIDGVRLANVVTSLDTSIASSFWQSRGWTFQESLLSARKVIFTPDQTYYHCQHGECSEDTYSRLHKSLELAPSAIPIRLNVDNQSNWTIYRNIIAEYCKRYLSFETDVLNALAGISSFMSWSIFLDCPLVMGIPFCSIEVGLFWHPSERLRRRTGTEFPSWSWAGWVGMVEYPDTMEYDNIFERTISHVRWEFESEAETSQRQEVITCMPPSTWPEWKHWLQRAAIDYADEQYYVHTNLPPTRLFAHPIPQAPWPIQAQTSLLKLTADVATLKLTGSHADLWYASEECAEGDHYVCRLQVYSRTNHRAGVAVMDGATYDSIKFTESSLFSFVKISQTTLAPGRDDPAWDAETETFAGKPGEEAINPQPEIDREDEEFDQSVYGRNICWCLYNVLVVRFEGDVARRIAVGQVHIHAFDRDSSMERRTFWLG